MVSRRAWVWLPGPSGVQGEVGWGAGKTPEFGLQTFAAGWHRCEAEELGHGSSWWLVGDLWGGNSARSR